MLVIFVYLFVPLLIHSKRCFKWRMAATATASTLNYKLFINYPSQYERFNNDSFNNIYSNIFISFFSAFFSKNSLRPLKMKQQRTNENIFVGFVIGVFYFSLSLNLHFIFNMLNNNFMYIARIKRTKRATLTINDIVKL